MTSLTPQQANETVRQLIVAGRFQEAEGICRQVLQGSPNDPEALHHLGLIADEAGRPEAAVELIRRAIGVAPNQPDYHYNLSEPLRKLGRWDEAVSELREAIRLRPDHVSAWTNLGALLARQGALEESVAAFRKAMELSPDNPAIYVNLGRVLRQSERLDEALDIYQKGIAIAPNFAPIYSALGSSLREAGRIWEAVASFRKSIELAPNQREVHSNLCYALYFDPEVTPAEILAEHRTWAARFAEPLRGAIQPPANDRSPERRLRIGYVSPDLLNHPVGVFMEPILRHHDRAQVEVFCYADVRNSDDMSRRLQAHTDVWRMTAGLPDEQLAQLIRQDRIDVLIDLTLHMRANRMTLFARKPAPVQITHLAYCGTSGLSTMDGCVTDPHLSPPGLNDAFFTEKLLRLKESYWCYGPSPTSPAVGPLPAASRGQVTFGSLNAFAKVNDSLVELWRTVLEAVPGSRLLVHAMGGEDNHSARERFTKLGIAPDRLMLAGKRPRDEYLDLYNRIDIAVDPFPYGGGTTSLDALWMGVPLVTLAGVLPVGRTGVTLLNNIGLPELVAQTPEQYVQIAAGLARDLVRLAELRSSLRARLQGSVLLDATRYVRNLEAAYRSAWRAWCGGREAGGS